MANHTPLQPHPIPQVMVSSTFTDLKEHREAIITAIHKYKLHANVMEYDDAKPTHNVIDSSIRMVRDSAAYILLIGLKYGQTPENPDANPHQLSITELEFNEAQRLGRPILLFIMGDDHPVKKNDIERDPNKERKLDAFRERARNESPDSSVHRVYSIFNSLDEFKEKMGSSLSELAQLLKSSTNDTSEEDCSHTPTKFDPIKIPKPPKFYAEPAYIGSHQFVGRSRELEDLSDWAKPSDPTNLLLYEAIGGNGKSMLTWEWTTKHATQVRDDWAGRFWYSFYERGAIMVDFCQRALAYMTGQPLEELRKKKIAELKEPLLAQLQTKPWLLILDGLERVLVAYHRIDAAEMPDEEANRPTDKIVERNPRDAIRDEDNDLLRALAAAAPSKILISSRLIPRVLVNPSAQPVAGVKRIALPGLRPPDAEALLRSCGIDGDSVSIQSYLATNCDNHPLVIGILGGLVTSYLPARGNFDKWVADKDGGAKLDLASLDLIQRRNHILRTALDALPSASRQLLSVLALLSDPADYEILLAFNPHLPPEPDEVRKPSPPEQSKGWEGASDEEKASARSSYETAFSQWEHYEEAVQTRLASAQYREAPQKLTITVSDLEQRGLLQYDRRADRYDLHPVVRAVAASELKTETRQRFSQQVVDYFSSQAGDPYSEAMSLKDLGVGLHIVRTLLRMGRYKKAYSEFDERGLKAAMKFNLEANVEILSLLRPFFPNGWGTLNGPLGRSKLLGLAVDANHMLRSVGQVEEAINSGGSIIIEALRGRKSVRTSAINRMLISIASACAVQNWLRKEVQCRLFALELAGDRQRVAWKMGIDYLHAKMGRLKKKDFRKFTEIRSPVIRALALRHYAYVMFWNGELNESILDRAESAEKTTRHTLRELMVLRAKWKLESEDWSMASTSFSKAIRMARESGIPDVSSETGLALAKYHLGQLDEPQREAERLAGLPRPSHRLLAQLWIALGDTAQAKHHALAAYQWAWADGEPYVHCYELTRTTELLRQMSVPILKLPAYDPAKDEPFPWEADVRAYIEKLRERNKGEA